LGPILDDEEASVSAVFQKTFFGKDLAQNFLTSKNRDRKLKLQDIGFQRTSENYYPRHHVLPSHWFLGKAQN